VEINKKMTMNRLPNTMIVNLQRLEFDMETMNTVKINDKFEFPKILNMRPYMRDLVVNKTRAEFSGKKS
jgi:ubiquitin carboxyl-terminal hydrolase 34